MKFLKRIYEAAKRRAYKALVARLNSRNVVVFRTLANLGRERLIRTMYPEPHSDYVRLATLELCAEEIRRRGIAGSVAEVGVYKGEFARRLNAAFPDRTLYLFDTFEGFVEEELRADVDAGLASPKAFRSDVAEVMARMPRPERVRPIVGKFDRHSLASLDETERFAFVSLDVDLHAPTLEGLHAFYPRLSKGGYIFVHDYNNDQWRGIAKAVHAFVEASGAVAVPIPDTQGTIIIAK